jgi:hypothetical protein
MLTLPSLTSLLSGPNPEYVYNLCDAMRKYFNNVVDEHLFELEEILREMEEENLENQKETNLTQSSADDAENTN